MLAPSLEDGPPDIAEEASPHDTLIGWVDVYDLLQELLALLPRPLPEGRGALADLLANLGDSFSRRHLVTLLDSKDRSLLWTARASFTLLDLAHQVFFRGDGNGRGRIVHRCALFNTHGDIVQVISQTDILRAIVAARAAHGHWASTPLGDSGLVRPGKGVISVPVDWPAVAALQRCKEEGVLSVAVVDDDGGRFVGSLGATNLRGLRDWTQLAAPCGELLAAKQHRPVAGYIQAEEEEEGPRAQEPASSTAAEDVLEAITTSPEEPVLSVLQKVRGSGPADWTRAAQSDALPLVAADSQWHPPLLRAGRGGATDGHCLYL